jgi:hypothetical protein
MECKRTFNPFTWQPLFIFSKKSSSDPLEINVGSVRSITLAGSATLIGTESRLRRPLPLTPQHRAFQPHVVSLAASGLCDSAKCRSRRCWSRGGQWHHAGLRGNHGLWECYYWGTVEPEGEAVTCAILGNAIIQSKAKWRESEWNRLGHVYCTDCPSSLPPFSLEALPYFRGTDCRSQLAFPPTWQSLLTALTRCLLGHE